MSLTAAFNFVAIDKFTAPLKQMAAALSSLKTNTDKANKGYKSFGETLKDTGSHLRHVGHQLEAVGKKMATHVSAEVIALGYEAFKAADDLDKLTLSFKTLIGDGKRANELVDQLEKFAQANAVNKEELEQAATQMLAFGMSADKIAPSMKMLADVAQGAGGNLGELGGAFALVKRQGGLTERSMRKFSASNVDMLTMLAVHYGKSKNEISEMVKDHKIKFSDVDKTLKEYTSKGGKYFGVLDERTKQLGGQFRVFKNISDDLFESFGQAINEAFGVSDSMQEFNKWFAGLGEHIKEFAKEHKTLFKWAVGLAAVAAAAAPVLIALGMLVSLGGLMTTGFGVLSGITMPLLRGAFGLLSKIVARLALELFWLGVRAAVAFVPFIAAVAPFLAIAAAAGLVYAGLKKILDLWLSTDDWNKIFDFITGGDTSKKMASVTASNTYNFADHPTHKVDVNVSGHVKGANTTTTAKVTKRGKNM